MVLHETERVSLGPEPLRQFRNQPEKIPTIVIPPKEDLTPDPTGLHIPPANKIVNAKRSSLAIMAERQGRSVNSRFCCKTPCF
jgi:hypothetical protein